MAAESAAAETAATAADEPQPQQVAAQAAAAVACLAVAAPAVALAAPAVVKVAPPQDDSEFRDRLLELFGQVINQFGGPQQYLLHTYPDAASRGNFAAQLQTAFPRQGDQTYQDVPQCPDADLEVTLHLSDLGFTPRTSTKPPPYKHTAWALAQEYVYYSFLTKGPRQ